MMRAIQLAVVLVVTAGHVQAGLILSSEYSLTEMTGTFAGARSGWAADEDFGYYDNVADLGVVGALLSDGYTFSPGSGGSGSIGIVNIPVPSSNRTLTFEFSGATPTLDSLSFLTTRNWDMATIITVETMIGGGGWVQAASFTTGALGIPEENHSVNTAVVPLGGVVADAFRFGFGGNDQLIIHEISVDGSFSATTVPEPSSLALLATGAFGLFGYGWRRKRKLAA